MGGADVGSSIRRMLRKVASFAVWSQYNSMGRGEKFAFNSLKLYRVLYGKIWFIDVLACHAYKGMVFRCSQFGALSCLWSACNCCRLLSLARFAGHVLLMCDEN